MDTEEKPTALSKLDITSPSDTPSIEEGNVSTRGHVLSDDKYHLATLSYKQEFLRSLGFFESWAATFTSVNFMSGIPVLFGFVMYTSGPKAAFANWTMIGGLSYCVSLALAEIVAGLPTAGGIYYWSYRLGGEEWSPFLPWMTA
jgi:Amino acid permease